MMKHRKPSKQTRAVLAALVERAARWQHGYDLMESTGIASGTLYPMLMRLCDQRLLEAKWEPSPLEGRPNRHVYRLTEAGLNLAAELGRERDSAARPAGSAV